MPRKKKYDRRGRPPNHKPVCIIELDETFKSYEQAADRIGGNRGEIYLCLKGDRKTHKGFSFKWVDKLIYRVGCVN